MTPPYAELWKRDQDEKISISKGTQAVQITGNSLFGGLPQTSIIAGNYYLLYYALFTKTLSAQIMSSLGMDLLKRNQRSLVKLLSRKFSNLKQIRTFSVGRI